MRGPAYEHPHADASADARARLDQGRELSPGLEWYCPAVVLRIRCTPKSNPRNRILAQIVQGMRFVAFEHNMLRWIGATSQLHCETKYQKPQSPYTLYQEHGF
eukprot:851865-Rhodomonas_salina.1